MEEGVLVIEAEGVEAGEVVAMGAEEAHIGGEGTGGELDCLWVKSEAAGVVEAGIGEEECESAHTLNCLNCNLTLNA